MPKKVSKNVEWLKDVPFSHRGLHNKIYPENSLGAFKNSMNYGYGIELDVLLTKDEKVVVFHDYNLERMTGIDKNLNDLTYNELTMLSLSRTNEKIPLLSEALDLIDSKVPVIIEIKPIDEYIIICEKVHNISRKYEGKYAIQSFDPRVLKWYKENANEVIRGQVSTYLKDTIIKWYKKLFLDEILFNINTKPDYICYSINKINNLRIKCMRKKMPIVAWTIKDIYDMEKGYKYADNIIFEDFFPPINKKC